MKIYIGIDNGITGTIGAVTDSGKFLDFLFTPTFSQTNYTKDEGGFRTRVHVEQLRKVLAGIITKGAGDIQPIIRDHAQYWDQHMSTRPEIKVVMERPMINPRRFPASISAVCALEATLIVLESMNLAYEVIAPQKWQSEMLPKVPKKKETREEKKERLKKEKGKPKKKEENLLKKFSLDIGRQLFPMVKDFKHDDCDGLLIAEWARRKRL